MALVEARLRAAEELARLPTALRELAEPASYQVSVAPALRALAAEVDARHP